MLGQRDRGRDGDDPRVAVGEAVAVVHVDGVARDGVEHGGRRHRDPAVEPPERDLGLASGGAEGLVRYGRHTLTTAGERHPDEVEQAELGCVHDRGRQVRIRGGEDEIGKPLAQRGGRDACSIHGVNRFGKRSSDRKSV